MRILIVEDNHDIRYTLKDILEKMGHRVFILQENLKVLENLKKNNIEMVIIDIDHKSGADLCRSIRSFNTHKAYIYIIVLTNLNDKEALDSILRVGADDFLSKSLDTEELNIRITAGQRVVELAKHNMHLLSIITNSRNKFKVMIDALDESVITINKNKKIISANKAFLKFTEKKDFNEVINKPYTEVMNNIMIKEYPQQEKTLPAIHVLNSGTPLYTHATIKNPPNKIFLKIHSVPIKNQAGEIIQVVEIMSDITKETEAIIQSQEKNKALNKALTDLKAAQGQLIQSEKMASIGQLAAGVAHEINNPVGFIISNLRTLLEYQNNMIKLLKEYRDIGSKLHNIPPGGTIPEAITEQIKQIASLEDEIEIDYIQNDVIDLINDCYEGAERIKNIVNDLKYFAHPGEGKTKSTDINKNLETTLNVVWHELKYKAKIIKEYGELPEVRCYPQQLNQVFMNLLVNAAQAIKEQGEIKIVTRAVGKYVEIIISDTGVGIPEENLLKIFDPFFTTKEVGKGTGLGLHVVYNIIQKHHGTIDVKSTVNVGTTFTIRIPIDPFDQNNNGEKNGT